MPQQDAGDRALLRCGRRSTPARHRRSATNWAPPLVGALTLALIDVAQRRDKASVRAIRFGANCAAAGGKQLMVWDHKTHAQVATFDVHSLVIRAIELGRFQSEVAMEVNHYQGKRVTSDQLRHERAQPGFDREQHTNIDVETGGERWEMKRVGPVITKSDVLLDQVQKGAAKYVKLGVASLRRGGPKKNIVDVDFGGRIQIPGMDEAAFRARIEQYLGRAPRISKFVDVFVLHFTVDGKATQIVVEVGQ